MAFNIEVRKKQLQSLNQYIKSSRENVESIIKSIGWASTNVLEADDTKVTCPYDKNHLIPLEKANNHLPKCKIKTAQYDLNEEFLSEPPLEGNSSCIKLDNMKKIEILNAARFHNPLFKPAWNGHEADAMTSNRYLSTFSVDERLSLYDYAIANTEKPPVPDEFTLNLEETKKEGDETYEESLKKERDLKRRRAKYKSVHTNKKSHTEVMREVIDNQMEQYLEWLTQKEKQNHRQIIENDEMDYMTNNEECMVENDIIVKHEERPHSSISSRNSCHSSTSRPSRYNDDEKYNYEKSKRNSGRSSLGYYYEGESRQYEYNNDRHKSLDSSYSSETKRYHSSSRHEKDNSYHGKKYGYDKNRSSSYKSSYTDRRKHGDREYHSR